MGVEIFGSKCTLWRNKWKNEISRFVGCVRENGTIEQ